MASRSPTAVTPLPKLSSAPETPAKDTTATTTTTPQAVPFPPPQTFDIIPPLHGLLLRLLSPSNNVTGAAGHGATGDATGAGGPSTAQFQSQQQQQQTSMTGSGNNQHPGSATGGPASLAAEIAALSSNAPPPLDIKDLPTEASSIKIRIQKAQAAVEGLPDVQRSVAEQNQEIEELEDRIAKLQSIISDFGRRAGKASSQQSTMHQI